MAYSYQFPNNRSFYTRTTRYTDGELTTDTPSLGVVTWTDTIGSSDNPKWREKIKRHEGATTPRAGFKVSVKGYTKAHASIHWKDNDAPGIFELRDQVNGDISGHFQIGGMSQFTDAQMRFRVVNSALSRFYANAWNAINRFDGGTFVGEIRETLSLLKKPAKSVRKLIDAYYSDAKRRTRRFYRTGRRIDPVRVKDANKVVADTWLEYSFGIKPLLNDVKGAAEALAQLALDPLEVAPVRAYVEEFQDVSPADLAAIQKTRSFSPTFVIYDFSVKARRGYVCRYVGQVKIAVDDPVLMNRELFGFSPEQFVPTVWNLIPYSFLVDYFSNIGDVIAAWSFPASRIAWHNRTIRALKEYEILGQMRPPVIPTTPTASKIYGWHGTPTWVKTSSVFFERDSLPLGLPVVVTEIPGWSTKWANIGALAHMRAF
jgi:hypothetical protein